MIDEKDIRWICETYDVEDYGIADFFEVDESSYSEKTQIRHSRSMMPKEYVYKQGSDFKWSKYSENMEAQKEITKAFISDFKKFDREGRGLYIHSKTKGSGKTFLACCIVNEVIKKHDISVKFIIVPDFIELIKSKSESDREILKQVYECTLLIFDDIGAESNAQDWIQEAVFRLVDARNRGMLCTIYTSNVPMTELQGDERTVDRIIGHSVPLVMPEKSIRREKANKECNDFLKSVLGATEQHEDIFDTKNAP